MRIGGTDLSGLSGGLYQIYEIAGRVVFAILLGDERSSIHRLEYASVRLGSVILGLLIGAFPFGRALLRGGSKDIAVIWLLLAAGGSFLLGNILIGYIRVLRREELRQSPLADKRKSFDDLFEDKRKELLARDYPVHEAEREAWWFAKMCLEDCFVATAVFANPSAPEVAILRDWRDRRLRGSRTGRGFLAVYSIIGPSVACLVRSVSPLKRVFGQILTLFSRHLRRC